MHELMTSRAVQHHNLYLHFQAPDVINGLLGAENGNNTGH